MGAVLLQEQKDKTEQVVAYASRGLKDHEKNYPAFLLEKAAACWVINYFDTYLTPPKQFMPCSDHRPLKTMSTVHKKTLNNLQLYKEGWRNTVADALSRTQGSRYAWSGGQAGGRPRTTVCQHMRDKEKKKTLPTRTTGRFRVEQS
jgi:hypothetical protein